MIHELTNASFKPFIEGSDKPVLVDFWAPWCAPCRQISTVLSEVDEELKEKVQIAKVNVDNEPTLAQEFGIRSIPNLFVFKDGKPVRQLVGFHEKKTILDALQ